MPGRVFFCHDNRCLGRGMDEHISSIARQIAGEAVAFEKGTTGREPESVIVAVCDKTLIVALVSQLTPAERATAVSAIGAAQIQGYHRQLFASASENLRRRIERIAGVSVGAVTARVDVGAGTIVEGLATGSELDLFMFAGSARSPAPETSQPAGVACAGAFDCR